MFTLAVLAAFSSNSAPMPHQVPLAWPFPDTVTVRVTDGAGIDFTVTCTREPQPAGNQRRNWWWTAPGGSVEFALISEYLDRGANANNRGIAFTINGTHKGSGNLVKAYYNNGYSQLPANNTIQVPGGPGATGKFLAAQILP